MSKVISFRVSDETAKIALKSFQNQHPNDHASINNIFRRLALHALASQSQETQLSEIRETVASNQAELVQVRRLLHFVLSALQLLWKTFLDRFVEVDDTEFTELTNLLNFFDDEEVIDHET
jgi:hypothetical protein